MRFSKENDHSNMDSEEIEAARKRMKPGEFDGAGTVEEIAEEGGGEVTDTNVAGSEEMELNITHVLEKIERFTQQVSELLEAGKMLFKELSNEFEERMIAIHKEQMEKWQEEIKELRLLDVSNEEANALLHNARCLIQNVQIDS